MKIRPLNRAVAACALILAVLVTASCTRSVPGVASIDNGGVRKDAPPSDLKIEGSKGGELDQLVANSMDDIMTYWEAEFPKAFGKDMKPLAGGIHAYDPKDSTPIPCFTSGQKSKAANNAFYCPPEDAIAFDEAFAQKLVAEFGEFIVPLIFAHEFGHAIQDRVGVKSQKSIAWEGQADCYAGVFTKKAQEGTTRFKATSQDLDTVLGGYLMLRDTPGNSADDQQAHGSAFDRVGAFQEGFNEGAKHCFTAFDDSREYTEIPYNANDKANEGNLPYEQTMTSIPTDMNSFGKAVVGTSWQDVKAKATTGSSVKCDGATVKEQVFYCREDKTVYYNEKKFVEQSYKKYGDFAAMSAVALGYTSAILDASTVKKKGRKDLTARLCLIGAYAGGAFETTVSGKQSPLGKLQLSAGDLDEAVTLLIGIGEKNEFIDTYGMDAFERIDVFRKAVLAGREGAKDAAKDCLK